MKSKKEEKDQLSPQKEKIQPTVKKDKSRVNKKNFQPSVAMINKMIDRIYFNVHIENQKYCDDFFRKALKADQPIQECFGNPHLEHMYRNEILSENISPSKLENHLRNDSRYKKIFRYKRHFHDTTYEVAKLMLIIQNEKKIHFL